MKILHQHNNEGDHYETLCGMQLVEDIRKRSPVLKDLENAGEIKIVGALYDMDTGEIDFLD